MKIKKAKKLVWHRCVFCDGLGYHPHVTIRLMNKPEPVGKKYLVKSVMGKKHYQKITYNGDGKTYYIYDEDVNEWLNSDLKIEEFIAMKKIRGRKTNEKVHLRCA